MGHYTREPMPLGMAREKPAYATLLVTGCCTVVARESDRSFHGASPKIAILDSPLLLCRG